MKRTHPGRPRIDEDDDTVEVGVSLPAKQFDRYAKRALLEDVTVPEIIRRELQEKKRRLE